MVGPPFRYMPGGGFYLEAPTTPPRDAWGYGGTMRITLKLIISLSVVMIMVALISTWVNVGQEKTNLYSEVRRQSALLAETFRESAMHYLESGNTAGLQKLADRLHDQKRLEGVAVYGPD